jgi:N-acetylated-alpha-linked acidic dipeptidase
VDAAGKGKDAEGGIVPQRLGTGSDYLPFAHRLGVPSLHVRYGYDRDGDDENVPVYHSLYDTYTHYQRFGDPGLAYVNLLARTNARLVLRVANADVLPWRYTAFALSLGKDIDRLATSSAADHRDVVRRNALLEQDAYRLAGVAYRHEQAPARVEDAWQDIDLGPLHDAQRDLLAAAQAYDQAASAAGRLTARQAVTVNKALRAIAPAFLQASGLPQRPWYRHLLQAPGRREGEDTAPLPGIGDAIDARAWDQARSEVFLTAEATRKATALLNQATHELTITSPPL